MQQLFSPTKPPETTKEPTRTQRSFDPPGTRVSISSAISYAVLAIVVGGLIFALSYTAAHQFSSFSETFSCFASNAECSQGLCEQPGESVECTSSAQCEVKSLQCQKTTAGLYNTNSCENECERSFACVDQSCELVGPGRGSYKDLTCDSQCD